MGQIFPLEEAKNFIFILYLPTAPNGIGASDEWLKSIYIYTKYELSTFTSVYRCFLDCLNYYTNWQYCVRILDNEDLVISGYLDNVGLENFEEMLHKEAET